MVPHDHHRIHHFNRPNYFAVRKIVPLCSRLLYSRFNYTALALYSVNSNYYYYSNWLIMSRLQFTSRFSEPV